MMKTAQIKKFIDSTNGFRKRQSAVRTSASGPQYEDASWDKFRLSSVINPRTISPKDLQDLDFANDVAGITTTLQSEGQTEIKESSLMNETTLAETTTFPVLVEALEKANGKRESASTDDERLRWVKVINFFDAAAEKRYLKDVEFIADCCSDRISKDIKKLEKDGILEWDLAPQSYIKLVHPMNDGNCFQLVRLVALAEIHGDPAFILQSLKALKMDHIDHKTKESFVNGIQRFGNRSLTTSIHTRGAEDKDHLEVEKQRGSFFRLKSDKAATPVIVPAQSIENLQGRQFDLKTIIGSLAKSSDDVTLYELFVSPLDKTLTGHAALIGKKNNEYIFYDPNFGRIVFDNPGVMETYIGAHMKRGSNLGQLPFYTSSTFGVRQINVREMNELFNQGQINLQARAGEWKGLFPPIADGDDLKNRDQKRLISTLKRKERVGEVTIVSPNEFKSNSKIEVISDNAIWFKAPKGQSREGAAVDFQAVLIGDLREAGVNTNRLKPGRPFSLPRKSDEIKLKR